MKPAKFDKLMQSLQDCLTLAGILIVAAIIIAGGGTGDEFDYEYDIEAVSASEDRAQEAAARDYYQQRRGR